jgi:hypothetical protein
VRWFGQRGAPTGRFKLRAAVSSKQNVMVSYCRGMCGLPRPGCCSIMRGTTTPSRTETCSGESGELLCALCATRRPEHSARESGLLQRGPPDLSPDAVECHRRGDGPAHFVRSLGGSPRLHLSDWIRLQHQASTTASPSTSCWAARFATGCASMPIGGSPT